jgi:hypothetical protein
MPPPRRRGGVFVALHDRGLIRWRSAWNSVDPGQRPHRNIDGEVERPRLAVVDGNTKIGQSLGLARERPRLTQTEGAG